MNFKFMLAIAIAIFGASFLSFSKSSSKSDGGVLALVELNKDLSKHEHHQQYHQQHQQLHANFHSNDNNNHIYSGQLNNVDNDNSTTNRNRNNNSVNPNHTPNVSDHEFKSAVTTIPETNKFCLHHKLWFENNPSNLLDQIQRISPDLLHMKTLLNTANSCLSQSFPSNPDLQYPEDPEEVFEQIHDAMADWLTNEPHCVTHEDGQKFCGPWVENIWIHHFAMAYCSQPANSRKLSNIFGPYIPLFIPWVDRWVNNSDHPWRYPKNMIATLKRSLRPNVPYITVSQNDEGLVATCNEGLNNADIPNVLVLSAGGNGHVPIPLIKQSVQEIVLPPIPFSDRSLDVSFLGSDKTTQRSGKLRTHLCNVVKTVANKHGYKYRVCETDPNWKFLMRSSKASLLPRGYGRSSYRVGEAIQMGLIPIVVYDDLPWIPYISLWKEFGFVTKLGEVPQIMEHISQMTSDELEEREIAVRRFAQSHYSWEGIIKQISFFMTGVNGGGDLVCGVLPPCPRSTSCAKQCQWNQGGSHK